MAWHILRPHAGKDFPKLPDYLGGKPEKIKPAAQTADQIAAVMRRYAFGAAITRTYPEGHPGPR